MFEMENGQRVNVLGSKNRTLMKPLDQSDQVKNNDDLMTRRLKNRERQRRYRARKRLEADMKKLSPVNNSTPQRLEADMKKVCPANKSTPQHIAADMERCTVNSSTPQQVETQLNVVTRIYCQRDWKKDARRVGAGKEQVVIPGGPVVADGNRATSLGIGAEARPQLETGTHSKNSPIQDDTERRVFSGRRHWKAEARNKKN